MLTRVDPLEQSTREFLHSRIDESFKFKEGESLDSVISEVLNDKDLLLFFARNFKENEALKLGHIHYYDDADAFVTYGLILDRSFPISLKLFNYDSDTSGYNLNKISKSGDKFDPFSLNSISYDFTLSDTLPDYSHYSSDLKVGPPTPEEFCRKVNDALSNLDRCKIKIVN